MRRLVLLWPERAWGSSFPSAEPASSPRNMGGYIGSGYYHLHENINTISITICNLKASQINSNATFAEKVFRVCFL